MFMVLHSVLQYTQHRAVDDGRPLLDAAAARHEPDLSEPFTGTSRI
jgi:hypothetical protein